MHTLPEIIKVDLGNNPSTDQLYSTLANNPTVLEVIEFMELDDSIEIKWRHNFSGNGLCADHEKGVFAVSDLWDFVEPETEPTK